MHSNHATKITKDTLHFERWVFGLSSSPAIVAKPAISAETGATESLYGVSMTESRDSFPPLAKRRGGGGGGHDTHTLTHPCPSQYFCQLIQCFCAAARPKCLSSSCSFVSDEEYRRAVDASRENARVLMTWYDHDISQSQK